MNWLRVSHRFHASLSEEINRGWSEGVNGDVRCASRSRSGGEGSKVYGEAHDMLCFVCSVEVCFKFD